MTRAARILLRLVSLVLALSVVGFILVASFQYMWRNAEANSPRVVFAYDATDIDSLIDETAARAQLFLTGVDISVPVDPDDDTDIRFEVYEGASTTAVAYQLERENLIASADAFRYYVQAAGGDRAVQAGTFTLRRSMTMHEIMRELQTGGVADVQVTIAEGWRLEQVAAELEARGIVSATDFIVAVRTGGRDEAFLASRPEGASSSLEGYLFPDTYRFEKNTQPQAVLDRMLENWASRVGEELLAEAEASGMTLYELVALASLVEREAVLDEERSLIARVYLNRLAIDMPLQADPTVQYAKANALGHPDALGETWPTLERADLNAALWPTLTRDELNAVESPYNTYLHPGLPPGPICSPGLASIEAAIRPAAPGSSHADALYFVAVADDRVSAVPPERATHLEELTPGMHLFTASYDEHLQNDAHYGEH